MPSYTQSNTDPVSVNGMYLKFYLDVLRDMTTTFQDGGNVSSFNLYAMFLRSTVAKKDLRDEIDNEVIAINQKILDGVYGELGKDQATYIRGFCVVSAAMRFIGDAFHIIQNDSASLIDITDENLMSEFERYMMSRKVRQALGNNRDKIKLLEKRISDGSIPNMAELMQELLQPEELVPQDDDITQEALSSETAQEYSNG